MTEPVDLTLELLRRIDGRQERMEGKLDVAVSRIDGKLDETVSRLTRLEAKSTGMAEDLRFVRNTMAAMERAHASQVETSATLMERMDRLKDEVEALTRRMEAVETEGR